MSSAPSGRAHYRDVSLRSSFLFWQEVEEGQKEGQAAEVKGVGCFSAFLASLKGERKKNVSV